MVAVLCVQHAAALHCWAVHTSAVTSVVLCCLDGLSLQHLMAGTSTTDYPVWSPSSSVTVCPLLLYGIPVNTF